MDPTAQQTPQYAQGSRLTLAVRFALVVVFVGLLAGVAYVLSVNKNPQTTTTPKETSQETTQISPTKTEKQLIMEFELTPPPKSVVCKRFTSLEAALKFKDVACVLDLSSNNLTSVPNEILKLTKLNEINLSNNNFTEIPKILFEIPTLNSVDLSNNQINKQPDLDTLNKLHPNLTGNPITNKTAPTSTKTSPSGVPAQPVSNLKITY